MPTYKVVFRNGENRTLIVDAKSIGLPKDGVYRFLADDDERRVMAVVPADQVLYIVEDEAEKD